MGTEGALPFHAADGVTEGAAQGTKALPLSDRSLALSFSSLRETREHHRIELASFKFLFHHIQDSGKHFSWTVCPDLFIVGHHVDMGQC